MAQNVKISSVLNRKLKDGKEYDKLMPRVSCTTTPLGDGDTFFTVDRMKDWIEKFSYQTEKIALQLKGRTVEETANNIYNFLYSHVQYKADGQLQQLRSPACTWAQRKEGVDCKSYSVFASSILSNLGITHAIRQVRQAYFYPEEFTHVYVVVFKDQSNKNYDSNAPTFVIDATKHENTEVNFIDKVDIQMINLKHVGLNAPQDSRTQNIVENFDEFSRFLNEKGIPMTTVNAMRTRVSQFTTNGQDPTFKIVDQGVEIQGQLFVLNFSKQEGYQEGLGVVLTATAAMTAGKALMSIMPKDFLGKTFGAVFANGFDLSCWGASYNETKAQEYIQKDLPFLLNDYSKLSQNPTTATYNKFLNGMHGYIADAIHGQLSKYAKCTRKGFALRQKLSEDALDKVKTTLEGVGFKIIPAGTVKGYIKTPDMPSAKDENRVYEWGQSSKPYDYPSVRLEGGSSQAITPEIVQPVRGRDNNYQVNQPTVNTIPSGNVQTGSFGGGSQQQNVNPNTIQAKPAGSNTGLIIGGVALASLPFLFMMKSKSNK